MPQCKATNTFGGEPIQCQKALGHTSSHHHKGARRWFEVHWPNLRTCGHRFGELCACVKVRKEPITAHEAFLLLARSL